MSDERILLVAGLPSKTCQNNGSLYNLFGTYGAIQQIRVGSSPFTKGYCIVVYELCDGARKAMENLNNYQVKDRRLRVSVYDERDKKALERRKRKREIQTQYKKHVAALELENSEE